MKDYYYLALGDSYTIGESVPAQDNFPNQVTNIFSNKHRTLQTRIVAKTGWTTDELQSGITASGKVEPFREKYDFVSLLIGVNNQYRGRTPENYTIEFAELLNRASEFAENNTDRVIVLSIPDWGITPFAEGRDRISISRSINEFNSIAQKITKDHHIHFLAITEWTREAASNNLLLTSDGLHPSGKEYARWAKKVAEYFSSRI